MAQMFDLSAERAKRQPAPTVGDHGEKELINMIISSAADEVGRWMLREHPEAAYTPPEHFAGAAARLTLKALGDAMEELSKRPAVRM